MTESNLPAVVNREDFLVLQAGSYAAEAMEANMEGGAFSEQDLIQVKTPSGGAVYWEVDGPSGKEAKAFIEGVIVFKSIKGILWPSEEMSDDIPVLVSDDMKVGKLMIPFDDVPEDMQVVLIDHKLTEAEIRTDPKYATVPAESLPLLFWWDGPKKLPYCEYGSSTKKDAKGVPSRGKRAKDKQILFVLPKNVALPIRIELGPTSIKPVKQFMMQNSDMPYYRFITKIGLKKIEGTNPYAVATLQRTDVLSKEAGDMLKAQYTDVIKAAHDAGKLNLVTADAE